MNNKNLFFIAKYTYTAKEIIAFLFIIIIGFFFRIYKFNTIPFGLNHDASLNGLAAIDLWQRLPSYTPYYTGWVGETLYHYWLGFNFIILGINPVTLKLASIFVSLLTLPIFYLLARFLQGKKTALFSLFFLAISGWHITMSKVGWLAILVPLFQSVTFLFLFFALKSGRKLFWFATGISLAMTLNTYSAAKITPLVILFSIIFWGFKNRRSIKIKEVIFNILIFVLTFTFTILPLLSFVISDWDTYSSRMNFLSVTNRIKETGSLAPILENIKISVGMLHFRANGDDFFVKEPLLETIPGILFLVGFIFTILNIKKIESFLTLIWLLCGFIPGILSVPNGNHDFGILVPVYLIIGQGTIILYALIHKLNKGSTRLSYALISIILLLSFADTYNQYLSKNRREIFGFYPETTIVANHMKRLGNEYDFYLTDNYPRDALTFITYPGGYPFTNHYTWVEKREDFLTVRKNPKRGIVFFMFSTPQNEVTADILTKKFPKANKSYLWYKDDNISRVASLVVKVSP